MLSLILCFVFWFWLVQALLDTHFLYSTFFCVGVEHNLLMNEKVKGKMEIELTFRILIVEKNVFVPFAINEKNMYLRIEEEL